MIELPLALTVAAVVREGSFERAARALNLTPSAVSQRIKLLEERLGAVLVVRGQPCTATEAGARVARHAETVALLEQGLRQELPDLLPPDAKARAAGHAAPRPVLRIAVNADSLATWFVAALARVSETEHARFDVLVDDQDQTASWLARGQVLAAVTAAATPVQGFRSRRLGALRYRATASPGFVRRWFGAGVDAEGLRAAPSLGFGPHDQLQERWARKLLRRDLRLDAHRLPSTHAFVEAALCGLGWGLNPEPLVAAHLARGRLVELVPGRPLDVPLHWQVARLELPLLATLTREVEAAAAQQLVAAA